MGADGKAIAIWRLEGEVESPRQVQAAEYQPPEGKTEQPTGGGPRPPVTQKSGTASAARVVQVKGGKALVQVRCNKVGKCSGTLNLFKKQSAKKKIFIGKRESFTVGKGKTRTIKVQLTRKGKRLLQRAKHHRFNGFLSGRGVKNRPVLVKQVGS